MACTGLSIQMRAQQVSPLDTLEVPRNATEEEIRKAYRKMAFKYHPDRNNDSPVSIQKFLDIKAAYDFLKQRNFITSDLSRSENKDPNEIIEVFWESFYQALNPPDLSRQSQYEMESEIRSAFNQLEELKAIDEGLYMSTVAEGLGQIESRAERSRDWQEEQWLYSLAFSLQSDCEDLLKF